MLLIGSLAFNYLADSQPGIVLRTPNDYDYIATFEEAKKLAEGAKEAYPTNQGKYLFIRSHGDFITEVEIAWPGTTAAELLEQFEGVAPLDVLYTLKMSHRYLRNSPHFHKTRKDIMQMRAMGAKIFDEDWFKRREAETYWYQHPNLNRSKEEFFTDDVPYVYDHDWLHEVVATGLEPMYRNYLKDGSPVQCDKKKWDALILGMKAAAVYEEAAVLALERSLVSFPGVKSPRDAWLFALEKVCTSITSGWFREFAWEHYDGIVELHDFFHGSSGGYYTDKFERALKGEVKYHTPATSLEMQAN